MDRDALIDPAEAFRMSGGISESTARRRIREGSYPAPVVLGRDRRGKPVRVAFVYGEILDWCREQIAANRASNKRSA